jgi:hypothetical protein
VGAHIAPAEAVGCTVLHGALDALHVGVVGWPDSDLVSYAWVRVRVHEQLDELLPTLNGRDKERLCRAV